MKKILVFLLVGVFIHLGLFTYAQEETEPKKILILREAQEKDENTVAVEVHLTDNILEVMILAKMIRSKPRIYNALIVGSRLGRLSSDSREVLLATVEDEKPFPTTKKDTGFISFGNKEENKKGRGTLTRELLVFKVPRDRVASGKKYRLWVQIESMQRGGKYKTFKFDLKDLPELLQ